MLWQVIICLVCFFCFPTTSLPNTIDLKVTRRFLDFLKEHRRGYSSNSSEFVRRLQYFADSVKRHEKLNALRKNGLSAIYGLNKFSDMHPNEFKSFFLGLKKQQPRVVVVEEEQGIGQETEEKNQETEENNRKKRRAHVRNRRQTPRSWDWRIHNVTTKVKTQKCTDCWSFGIIETIESTAAMRRGAATLTERSVQQVLECSPSWNGDKCRGEYPNEIVDWLFKNRIYVTTANSYPYMQPASSCRMRPTTGARVLNYELYGAVYGRPITENDLANLLTWAGPLIIEVASASWQDYVGGVISSNCDQPTDHVVQLVGYNMQTTVPYWIVRNSWGSDYGNQGYVHVAMNKYMCRITDAIIRLESS